MIFGLHTIVPKTQDILIGQFVRGIAFRRMTFSGNFTTISADYNQRNQQYGHESTQSRPPPEFREQTAIAAVLSDMDAEIAVLEARRDKTRALKQGDDARIAHRKNKTHMSKNDIGQRERLTQNRVVALFRDKDKLGYDYLGNWEERIGNRNIEADLLRAFLKEQGHDQNIIDRALYLFEREAGDTSKSLYDRNRAVYELLRYGVKVKPDVGENTQTVWLIDWKNPEKNHFAIAEEVTVSGPRRRKHEAPRHRALRQRDCARRFGAQAFHRLGG